MNKLVFGLLLLIAASQHSFGAETGSDKPQPDPPATAPPAIYPHANSTDIRRDLTRRLADDLAKEKARAQGLEPKPEQR